MALKITTAEEVIEVKTVCATIYSQPGLGKTSLSFTANNPLLLDFDKGAHRAVDRKDTVQVERWSDVAGIKATDLEGYDTIIIDTVGKALDVLTADIVRESKYAYGGALNQQGWGQLGVRFSAYLRLLRSFGKDIILIAHMDEVKGDDGLKERLKIPGGTQALVCTDSDVMARISIFNKTRNLVYSPTEASFGKDPGGIGSIEVPDASAKSYSSFMADQISEIKEKLNSLSAAQVERKSEVEWFNQALPNVVDADGINALLARSKKAGRDVAKMVVDRANALGLTYDGDERKYVYLEEAGPDEGDQHSADAA